MDEDNREFENPNEGMTEEQIQEAEEKWQAEEEDSKAKLRAKLVKELEEANEKLADSYIDCLKCWNQFDEEHMKPTLEGDISQQYRLEMNANVWKMKAIRKDKNAVWLMKQLTGKDDYLMLTESDLVHIDVWFYDN